VSAWKEEEDATLATVASEGAVKMDGPARNGWGNHIEDDVLELYALDRLSEPGLGSVEEHLLLCEYCRGRLEEMDEFVVSIRDAIDKTEPPEEPAERLSAMGRTGGLKIVWAVLAAAAAVVAVAYMGPYGASRREPVTVQLRAMRGEAGTAVVKAAALLDLRMDVTGLPTTGSYRVDIVDASGKVRWTASGVNAGPNGIEVKTQALDAGAYWVRLIEMESGETAREYGLRVE
jgi:hypothetical protein